MEDHRCLGSRLLRWGFYLIGHPQSWLTRVIPIVNSQSGYFKHISDTSLVIGVQFRIGGTVGYTERPHEPSTCNSSDNLFQRFLFIGWRPGSKPTTQAAPTFRRHSENVAPATGKLSSKTARTTSRHQSCRSGRRLRVSTGRALDGKHWAAAKRIATSERRCGLRRRPTSPAWAGGATG